MHHGDELPEPMADEALREGFGPTGEFPEGRMNKEDEGEIQFGVAHDPVLGTVIFNFGKPVAWIAMTNAQATDLAASLLRHARGVRILCSHLPRSAGSAESHGQDIPAS